MDRRRAAGALLALAACIACSAAAPTASNHTALDLYEGAPEGCYYNFQHYGEGDRIMTNEPCLNCTCHNRMLMCYLRVCPFTKAIGQDCTVEKRADQCCPIVTCPDVPVDLLTSTSTTSPAEYGATGLGKLDKYGCSISGKYFPEGSKVPPTPNKPCEHCYCIRNMTTCVMQECTLHVDGCTPIYHKDVCCPVRYSCDHPEDEVPLLDDMSTTVRPTPGFLLTTTTISPVTQMTQDCLHDDQVFADGALIKTEKACEHCYCMKGDIVCVVQECGAPMENEGKNCTSLPPREGQCCPDTYICEGDELTSDLPTESTTDAIIEKLTTLSPPRRTSDEGSGYRNEPDEAPYTEMPIIDSEVEGSGDEQEVSKPVPPNEMIPGSEDGDQYIYVTTKAPAFEEHELTISEIDKNINTELDVQTDQPHVSLSSTITPGSEEVEKLTTSGLMEDDKRVHTTTAPETYESITTELGESLNTVPDEIAEAEITKPHDYASGTTTAPTSAESESLSPIEDEDNKPSLPEKEQDVTTSTLTESDKPEYSTPSLDEIEKEIATSVDISSVTPEVMTEYSEADIPKTTISSIVEETESTAVEDKESFKPEKLTTANPLEEEEKTTTELDHAQNTVAVADEETAYPHSYVPSATVASPSTEEETTTMINLEKDIVTDKDFNENVIIPHDHVTTAMPALHETEPDRGMNTIPSENNEETSSESSIPEKTTPSLETKGTESSITDEMHTQSVDIKTTITQEVTTLSPDGITTKIDQSTITTEPSFRKEDEIMVSTEKPKEFEQTTVKSEFVDEGLIPTSAHDEKTDISSKVPSTEEEFTTSIPEYITETTETIGLKQTTISTQDTAVVTESSPEKVSEPSNEQDSDLSSSTEKLIEVTPFYQENTDIQQEPSRIPGEGDCLLNGITYKNNTVVPSTNNCHTGCRCASSIIKCDPIICSPPPDYMDNCQSIYDSPDSCCPTYVCDHPRETVPPQSDNQMSGTESPMPSPTIECRGDQCEISQPTKQPTEPLELKPISTPETECGAEGCGEDSHTPDMQHPSGEQSEKCTNGKCETEGCINGECHLPQTHGQVSPVKPCEGEHCEKIDKVTSASPQLCENKEDCKSLEIPAVSDTPCEGKSCNKVDCGEGGCDSDAIVSPNKELESCKDKGDCKPQDIPAPDCSGDEPCRRKEISPIDEKSPSACEGSNCVHEHVTTVSEGNVDLSTELPKTEQTPIKDVPEISEPADEDKATEVPDIHLQKPETEKVPVEDIDYYTTESQTDAALTNADNQKEKPVIEDEATKKPTTLDKIDTETPAIIDETNKKEPTAEAEITDKPTVIENEGTESPVVTEEGTSEHTLIGEKDEEPVTVSDNLTEKPTLSGDKDELEPVIYETESTPKPVVIEKDTELTTAISEIDTEKPAILDEDSKGKPLVTDKESTNEEKESPNITKDETTTIASSLEDESSEKPSITGERSTDIPAIISQDGTSVPDTVVNTEKPSLSDEDGKEKPNVIDKDNTDKLSGGEDDTEKPFTNKPIEDITTEEPVVIDTENTDNPVVEDETTKIPDHLREKSTSKPILIDEEDIEKPVDGEEKITDKPIDVIETDTEMPYIGDEDSEKKPPIIGSDDKDEAAILDEDGTQRPTTEDEKIKPIMTEQETEKPTSIHEEGEEKPLIEEDDNKEPVVISQDNTEKPIVVDVVEPESTPDIEDEHKDKPVVVSEASTEFPNLVDEEKSSESPVTTVNEGTEEPTNDENDTEKPALTPEDEKQKPSLLPEDEKVTPAFVDTDIKEKPAIEEDGTELPVIVGEAGTDKPIGDDEGKEKPVTIDRDTTIKPSITEDESTSAPDITDHKDTVQPTIVDYGTEEPIITIKEDTTESGVIDNEGTELPAVSGEVDTEKPMIIDEEAEEKPDITDQESTKKPDNVDEITNKPTFAEEEGMSKPTVSDDAIINESSEKPDEAHKEHTEIPKITEDFDTDKPVLIDEEGKVKPVDEEQTIQPDLVEEIDQEKPTEDKDKPVITDNEVSDKPAVNEVEITENIHDAEGSGSEAPIVPQTPEPEKEQSTEKTVDEIEITTKTSYDSQTTPAEDIDHALSTDSNDVGTETPEKKVTQHKDETKDPGSLDHSLEITTQSLLEQEFTTKTFMPEQEKVTIIEQNVESTTSTYDNNDIKEEEASTVGKDLIGDEALLSTKAPQLHETPVTVEKTTETTSVSDDKKVSSDTLDIKSPTTSPPDDGSAIVEPQEGEELEKPKLPVTSQTEEESTTEVYTEKTVTHIPESHVMDTSSTLPEYSTSDKVTDISEIKDEDKTEPELPGEHSIKPDEVSTQLPIDKMTDHPLVHSSNKEEIITETPIYSVTEPERRFTEIEDPSVTGQQETATGYSEHVTEHHVSSATERIDEGTDIDTTSSEKPLSPDMGTSSDLPEKNTETDKPVTVLPEISHQTPEVDKKKTTEEFESPATEIPTEVFTQTQDITNAPEKDVTTYEDITTVVPDLSDQRRKGTTPVEEYTKQQESGTEIPSQHVTAVKDTESYTTESLEIKPLETSTKSEEHEITDTIAITTAIPSVSEKDEDAETKVPEEIDTEPQDLDKKEPSITEKQEQATELPTPGEDVQTDLPGAIITTNVPQSLVTEQKESLGEQVTESNLPKEDSSTKPELLTTQSEEISKIPDQHDGQEDIRTEKPVDVTESVEVSTKVQEDRITQVPQEAITEAQDTATTLRESPAVTEGFDKNEVSKTTEHTSAQTEFSETTPYLIELEEHTHKIEEEVTTMSPSEEHSYKPVEDSSPSSPTEAEQSYKPVEDISTLPPPTEDYTPMIEKHPSTISPFEEKYTTVLLETKQEHTTKVSDGGFETATDTAETTARATEEPEKTSVAVEEAAPAITEGEDDKYAADHIEYTTSAPIQISEESTPAVATESEKIPISESDIAVPTEKEMSTTEKPLHPIVSHETTAPEEEFMFSTAKPSTERQEEDVVTPAADDKFEKPSEKPSETNDVLPSSTTTEVSKPSVSDTQPTDEIPVPEEFPPSGTGGYGEPDYVEEDQAFGPGTCRYGGKVYVSAQQIPRDDPCDFCFCFRSDIICLQQSCPPPIHGCHEEPIQGFCCPRYECPVSMATTVNVTTTTTTTTTTLPPHFPTHSYKGAAHRRGCQIKGHTYKVGEVVRSSSGPCLHCTCGGDGQMKCDPKACTPEPMLRQMIAAAVSAKRRR